MSSQLSNFEPLYGDTAMVPLAWIVMLGIVTRFVLGAKRAPPANASFSAASALDSAWAQTVCTPLGPLRRSATVPCTSAPLPHLHPSILSLTPPFSPDVANSFGTSVGAKVLTLRTACIVAAIFDVGGALTLGRSVTTTIASKIIDVEARNKKRGMRWREWQ